MSGRSLIPMDHPYIEEHKIAERFVNGELAQQERESFEHHYVDCDECMDRVALAQIFRIEGRKPMPKKPNGIFHFLAGFTPRQQTLIFVASTLALLLMPVAAVTWMDHRTADLKPQAEPVIWLNESTTISARIPANVDWISLSANLPDQQGTYRLSIVDVSDRPLINGPDQTLSRGTAIGLRLASFPAGVLFAVVEKKAENGAYARVSRHPITIEWR